MDITFLLPMQLHSAIVLQTLALPGTLILCFTSMLRERSIDHQDEKQLVRLYKQHAVAFELFQLFVSLMACGLVTGNTVAAFEARSLVVGFAGEDVTAMIMKSWLVRNIWYLLSACCILVCMNMLDSWSLPQSTQDLTDPLFRLTRELVAAYIWRREAAYQNNLDDSFFDEFKQWSLSVEVDEPDAPPLRPTSESSDDTAMPLPSSPEETSKEIFIPELAHNSPNIHSEEDMPAPTDFDPDPDPLPPVPPAREQPPPATQTATIAYKPCCRPPYEAQTHASGLRITNKPTKPALSMPYSSSNTHQKTRARKRSVTFALQPTSSDEKDEAEGRRKRSRPSVRERVSMLEDSILEDGSTKVEERAKDTDKTGQQLALAAEKEGLEEEGAMAKLCQDDDLVVLYDFKKPSAARREALLTWHREIESK